MSDNYETEDQLKLNVYEFEVRCHSTGVCSTERISKVSEDAVREWFSGVYGPDFELLSVMLIRSYECHSLSETPCGEWTLITNACGGLYAYRTAGMCGFYICSAPIDLEEEPERAVYIAAGEYKVLAKYLTT